MMRVTATSMVIAVLLAACGGGGTGSRADAQSANGKPLEVAGVRPGMPVDEALATLRAKGFAIEPVAIRSYENELANEIALAKGQGPIEPDNRGIARFTATKSSEKVSTLRVAPGPNNGTILNVLYSTGMAGRTLPDFTADVIRKFGQPTRRANERNMFWCARGDTCVTNRNVEPMLALDAGSDNVAILDMRAGSRVENAAKQRFAAEIARRTGRPTSSF